MAFASTDDVAVRLGRDLTEAEAAMAEQVIGLVTGAIVDAVGKDADWADALDPIPATFQAMCIDKVIAVGSNPQGLAGESETLGHHTHSKTYRWASEGGGASVVALTDAEKLIVRRIVWGTTTSAGRTGPAILDDLYPYPLETLPD